MNAVQESADPGRPPIRRRRRGWLALAWAAAIVALYYGVSDWRSRRAWNEYRRDHEARVASLDLRTYVPKAIPDSENFAATPFAQAWFTQSSDTNFLYEQDAFTKADNMIYSPPRAVAQRQFEDLGAWQEAFAAVQAHAEKPKGGFRTDKLDPASRAQAASAVIDGMKDDNAALDELRAASARTQARYPIVYDMKNPWAIVLPHLVRVKQTCHRLQVRACAELAAGDGGPAFEDVKLSLYIANTLKTEPTVISLLVRAASLHIDLQAVWEGLAEHRWSEAQLAQLQVRLADYDLPADAQLPLHGEQAMGVWTGDFARKKGMGPLLDLGTGGDAVSPPIYGLRPFLALCGNLMPAGGFDREKLHYCQNFDHAVLDTIDPTSKRIFPGRVQAGIDAINALQARPPWTVALHHDILAALMLQGLTKVPYKVATCQTECDQAAVACALERYRLANGQFPDNLMALAPRFMAQLPHDVISGDSLKYHLNGDGRFVLYSVGWNEKDDGGTPGERMFDQTTGDWVWQYPEGK